MARASTPQESSPVGGWQHPQVSVVIPVYNEVENIPPLLDEIRRAMSNSEYGPTEMLFVEDGSDDGTAALIDDLATTHIDIRAVHLQRQVGQSAALAAGFDLADGKIVVAMDGDGQNDPADIPRLLDELDAGGYDCVSGNRTPRNDPLGKRIPSAIQTRLTDAMCADDINDFGCTLKAYRADVLEGLDLRGEHHRYIPAELSSRGCRLSEVEVNHRERAHGESSYGPGRLVRGFVDALYYLVFVRYGSRPIHLFGTLGLVLFAAGMGLGGHMLVERLVMQNPISEHIPRLIAIAVLVLGGLLLFVLGILSELLTQLLYKDERPYRIDRVVR